MQWQNRVGQKDHKKVFFVALIMIALPSHNSFQERTFSICTWFNSPIRQSLKGARFEMTVLIALHEVVLGCTVPSYDRAEEIVEKVFAKYKDMSANFDAEADMGADSNFETFLVRHSCFMC